MTTTTGHASVPSLNVRNAGAPDAAVTDIITPSQQITLVYDFGDGWPLVTYGAGNDRNFGYVLGKLVTWESPSANTGQEPGQMSNTGVTTLLGREALVYNYWLGKGFTDFQAAAAVGNFEGESGALDPAIWGGYQGKAFGIGQWLDTAGAKGQVAPRRTNLFNFAKQRNIDLEDKSSSISDRLLCELDYVWEELKTTESLAFKKIIESTSLEEAEDGFAYYERWNGYQSGRNGAEAGTHYSAAEKAYSQARKGAYNLTSVQTPTTTMAPRPDIAIGDSLALGIDDYIKVGQLSIDQKFAKMGNTIVAQVGAAPKIIQKFIDAIIAGEEATKGLIKGKTVALSCGASNSPSDVDDIDGQIKSLKTLAARVVVVGVSVNGTFPGQAAGTDINDRIVQISKQNGVLFTTGFNGSGPGNIHPANYGILVSMITSALNNG